MAKYSKISEVDKTNFETLARAMESGDAALVSCVRKSDGKPVAVICAMNRNEDDETDMIPLAVKSPWLVEARRVALDSGDAGQAAQWNEEIGRAVEHALATKP